MGGRTASAGLEGGTDAIRARALLDLLLNKDSRPHQDQPNPVGAALGGFAGRANLTVPLATLTSLAGRPGELSGLGPIDPWLARDLATAAAANPQEHLVRDGDRPGRARCRPRLCQTRAQESQETRGPGPPGFAFTPASRDGPPGGYGTWRLHTPGMGRTCWSPSTRSPRRTATTGFESWGHDPGVKLKHLSQIRHATCTSPICRRPAAQCDFEHNTPYEAGGRTCLCNGGPQCKR